MLGQMILERVSFINDLGVIMNQKTWFTEQIDVIVSKAPAMLLQINFYNEIPEMPGMLRYTVYTDFPIPEIIHTNLKTNL
jgi:hypothetical protein